MASLLVPVIVGVCLMSSVASVESQPGGPTISGCPAFPADNVWNTRVDRLPVYSRSAEFVKTIGRSKGLHPDFGSKKWKGQPIGIPFITVPGTQPRVPLAAQYAAESDPGPYPIPAGVSIEGGTMSSGDRHVIVVDRDNCKLYELFNAYPQSDGSWRADAGAIFDLRTNKLRPSGWTSADAAGLPILAGLVRYDEVASGEIRHALRFTAPVTQGSFVWPARHHASKNTSPDVPPMGQRFRLKDSFDISPYPKNVQVILTALKRYGMILSDNGGAWFITGTPDPKWDDDEVRALRRVTGDAFEAVDVSSLIVDPDAARARETR